MVFVPNTGIAWSREGGSHALPNKLPEVKNHFNKARSGLSTHFLGKLWKPASSLSHGSENTLEAMLILVLPGD